MTHMGLIRTDDDRHPRGRLRPPPDYTSRPVKLRLFAIVAARMLVLFVAEKARDPDNWRVAYPRPAGPVLPTRLCLLLVVQFAGLGDAEDLQPAVLIARCRDGEQRTGELCPG